MKVALVILFLISGVIAGCDIFSTRDAEQPTLPRTNFPQAFEHATLIDNFIASYREKSIFDYLICFSDSVLTGKSYTYIPSSGAASQYPALQDWNLRHEEDYFKNVMSEVGDLPVTLILSNSNFSQQGDSIVHTASYSLTVPLQEQGIPQNYQGDLIFYLLRDNLIWKIYFWQDIKSSDSPSWSELKGRFSN
jgi:hypothetical protein